MRNRGYKYVIRKISEGYMFLCINATWINQLLKDRGIKPREFRKLTWEDIAKVQTSESRKRIFSILQPKNFWEMCDTFALIYSDYDLEPGECVCEQDWFLKYPLFACEDIFELLLEEGFMQEDALRVMEVYSKGGCVSLGLTYDEFMQLYDVPGPIYSAMKKCRYIPPREKAISALLDSIERAIYFKSRNEVKKKESI